MQPETYGKIMKFAAGHYAAQLRPDNDTIAVYAIQLMRLCPIRLLRAVNECVTASGAKYFPGVSEILDAYHERPDKELMRIYEKKLLEYDRRWTAQKRQDPYARREDIGPAPDEPCRILEAIEETTAAAVLGRAWRELEGEEVAVARLEG